MKKRFWIVGGVLVLIGAGMWIGREGAQESRALTTEYTEAEKAANGFESGQDVLEASGEKNSGTAKSTKSTKVEAEKSAPLSDAVKALMGLDGKVYTYVEMLAAVRELGLELSAEEVAALMEMLGYPNGWFPEQMRAIEINAVKNDVLDRLLRQKVLPEGIGLLLAEMAGDLEQDPVWRDYCVQFMTPFYVRFTTELTESTEDGLTTKDPKDPKAGSLSSASLSVASGENQPDELQVIREAMFAALDERGGTIAGTSLIGLELLSRTHEEFDRALIVEKAVEMASDELASNEARMTALRLAASGNLKPETGNLKLATAETARLLAQTGETVLLRSAAIVTLGEIGCAEDRALLESYASADNRQLASAARMALETLNGRK
jgi:hypothetical protein